MTVERHQAVIIGGGPAGLAAAIRIRQKGVDDVVVLEREHRPGGILRQCIHDGFGLTRFGETLSGPEYAQRFVAQAEELGITCLTDTTVLSLDCLLYTSWASMWAASPAAWSPPSSSTFPAPRRRCVRPSTDTQWPCGARENAP